MQEDKHCMTLPTRQLELLWSWEPEWGWYRGLEGRVSRESLIPVTIQGNKLNRS